MGPRRKTRNRRRGRPDATCVLTLRAETLALSFALALLPAQALAESTDSPSPEPAPYAPWAALAPYRQAETLPHREAAPPPLVALPDYARRRFELLPSFGVGLPRCADGAASSCSALGSGLGGGFSGLYRTTPYFAFGFTFSFYHFGGEPGASDAVNESSTGSLFAGVLGRVYFAGEGAIDPWAELALGAGNFRTVAHRYDGTSVEELAAGPAGRVGLGIDFWLSRFLRVGPSLEFTSYLVGELRQCRRGGGCRDLAANDYGHPNGFASLGARLAIAFGEPL